MASTVDVTLTPITFCRLTPLFVELLVVFVLDGDLSRAVVDVTVVVLIEL